MSRGSRQTEKQAYHAVKDIAAAAKPVTKLAGAATRATIHRSVTPATDPADPADPDDAAVNRSISV